MLVRPRDVVLEVNLLRQVHLGRDGREDEALLAAVGQRELDLAVDAPRADEGRVQRLDAVCRHDNLTSGLRTNSVTDKGGRRGGGGREGIREKRGEGGER